MNIILKRENLRNSHLETLIAQDNTHINMDNILSILPISIENDVVEAEIIDKNNTSAQKYINSTFVFLLGCSINRMFPSAKLKMGGLHPTKGFYYDIEIAPPLSFSALEVLSNDIKANIDLAYRFDFLTKEEALKLFQEKQDQKDFINKSNDLYFNICFFNNTYDLLEYPPVISKNFLMNFVLLDISGIHNDQNINISRIYGQSFVNSEALSKYIKDKEILKQNDHRELGKILHLFHFQDESAGMAYWHPQGMALWKCIEDYIRASNTKYGCKEIKTPILAKELLWHKSGHLEKYGENIFSTKLDQINYIIRPMSCPMHIQVFRYSDISYKSLPVRLSEFGTVHRNESSGSLHGLFRIRSFVQDDGHIFCEEAQLLNEVQTIIFQALETYKDFGFTKDNILIKLALRPDNRIGSEEQWTYAEIALENALRSLDIDFTVSPKDGAFYGPKIEFHLKDNVGREWQCGTIQIDFFMTKRLDCTYTDSLNEKQNPILIHRAILGSIERFIGILLEHYEGKLPIWFSPTQIVLCSLSSKQDEYIRDMQNTLLKAGIRVDIDLRNETLNAKVRDNTIRKIPLIGVIGAKEQETNMLSIRDRKHKVHLMSINQLLTFINSKGDLSF